MGEYAGSFLYHRDARGRGALMDSLLELLSPLQLIAVGATALAAALLRAFTGFGFAMIAVPVFSLLLLPNEAVVLAATLTLAISKPDMTDNTMRDARLIDFVF